MTKKPKTRPRTRGKPKPVNQWIEASKYLRRRGYTWEEIDRWLDMTFEAQIFLGVPRNTPVLFPKAPHPRTTKRPRL
ncbi:MAG: hypothetical protein ABIP97_02465 [Chthoniobacterales bacterium]